MGSPLGDEAAKVWSAATKAQTAAWAPVVLKFLAAICLVRRRACLVTLAWDIPFFCR